MPLGHVSTPLYWRIIGREAALGRTSDPFDSLLAEPGDRSASRLIRWVVPCVAVVLAALVGLVYWVDAATPTDPAPVGYQAQRSADLVRLEGAIKLGDDGFEDLLDLLRSPDNAVAMQASAYISSHGPEGNVALLRFLSTCDEARAKVLCTAGRTAETYHQVMRSLQSGTEAERTGALVFLEHSATPTLNVFPVSEIHRDVRDLSTKEFVREAMHAVLRKEDALDPVKLGRALGKYRTEEGSELRELARRARAYERTVAVYALGSLHKEEAEELLQKLTRDADANVRSAALEELERRRESWENPPSSGLVRRVQPIMK